MGSIVGDSRQALLPPHLSATQMLFPSLSTSTALSDPHIRPSGSFAQFSTVRYGFGASLVGEGADCAASRAATARVASITTTRTRRFLVSFLIGNEVKAAPSQFTVTLTCTFVQQHWKPPPPSPDESLACRRRIYSPAVLKVAIVVAFPPSAALTAGLAGSNVTGAGPRNRLQFRVTGGGPPGPRPRADGSAPGAAGSAPRAAGGGP